MTSISLPYAIGTLTSQGTFLGMSGNLGSFSQDLGARTMNILCNPKLAIPICKEQDNQRLAKQSKPRGFFAGAQVFEGNAALEIIRALARKA